MTEVPSQTSRMDNPMRALAILKTFMRLLDIEVDTKELAENAKEVTEQIKQAMTVAMVNISNISRSPFGSRVMRMVRDEGDDEGTS